MLKPVTEVLLDTGDILYHEGDPNDCAYVIESGEILLYNDIDGQRIECERRGGGSILGETSVLTGQPRAVTVEAISPCVAYKISAEDILARLDTLDPVLRACLDTTVDFVSRFYSEDKDEQTPLAPSTLRNVNELVKKFKFELDIGKGIDQGEFSLVYQPIIELSNNRMAGFEALMRWQHPILGNVPPDRFIPVAEEMGSIGRLTDFAILQACKTLQHIQSISPAGNNLFASVNISGVDMARDNFAESLKQVLDQYELDPTCLKLELTETALLPNVKNTSENFEQIRQLGCGISIDDFGTGYSNLVYLKSLPLTAIKIDRAFTNDVSTNPFSRGIIKMLVGLGKDMNVDIVAEGLETPEDVKIVHDLGCRYAQGYYFSTPIAKRDIIEKTSLDLAS